MALFNKHIKPTPRGVIHLIADTGNEAMQGLVATGARIRDAEARMVKVSRSYIRENPFKSSAITMALGAMAASLIIIGNRRR